MHPALLAMVSEFPRKMPKMGTRMLASRPSPSASGALSSFSWANDESPVVEAVTTVSARKLGRRGSAREVITLKCTFGDCPSFGGPCSDVHSSRLAANTFVAGSRKSILLDAARRRSERVTAAQTPQPETPFLSTMSVLFEGEQDASSKTVGSIPSGPWMTDEEVSAYKRGVLGDSETTAVTSTSEDPTEAYTEEHVALVCEGSPCHQRRMDALVRATGNPGVACLDFTRCLRACGFSFIDGVAQHTFDTSTLTSRERMYPALHEAVYGALEESHGPHIANGYLRGPLWLSSEGVEVASETLEPGVILPEGCHMWDWVARDPVALCCDGLPSFTNDIWPATDFGVTGSRLQEASQVVTVVQATPFDEMFSAFV